jgi:acyl-CoA thioesterase
MSDAQRLAEETAQRMFAADQASKLLGMRIVSVAPGAASMTMTVRADMVNGHDICHGGLIFSLADSTFAFACNSYGDAAVAATGNIDFLAPGRKGDGLTAVASELWRSGRSGIYEVVVSNQKGERIALFRGRSHRIGESKR